MIQVIERFHRLLELVSSMPERMYSLTELAASIGVSASTCSNIVKTMTALGYLRQEGGRKGYKLGMMPFFLTRNTAFKDQLRIVSRPVIEALAAETGEMIVLVSECAGRRVELLRLEGSAMIQVKSENDSGSIHLFGCPTGAVILAHMDEARLRMLWKNEGRKDLTHAGNYSRLLANYAEIRHQGWCVSGPEDGIPTDLNNAFFALGIPVWENGQVTAAIGVKIPAYRYSVAYRDRIIGACMEASKTISGHLDEHRIISGCVA